MENIKLENIINDLNIIIKEYLEFVWYECNKNFYDTRFDLIKKIYKDLGMDFDVSKFL